MRRLIALALFALAGSACSFSTTVDGAECRMVKSAADVYRQGFNYTPVSGETYGEWWDAEGHLIGYASAEDSDVFNHVECF